MPLHLLGKKSWNVYNPANIARVRADEAAAASREAAEEQRMQELDAERRIAILRGVTPPPLPEEQPEQPEKASRRAERTEFGHDRKRRRLAGENDTDRDIRLAKAATVPCEDAAADVASAKPRKPTSNAPLTDHAGHINLFPVNERDARKGEKNAEAEAEKKKKEREFEDQYTMRFSNAAGKSGLEKPWYAAPSSTNVAAGGMDATKDDGKKLDFTGGPSKDAWGNDDPRRKGREKMRMSASDPLAFMQKAQTQLKQAQRDRKKWVEEKERETRELKATREKEERRESLSKRKSRSEDDEELEDFSLDAADSSKYESRRRDKEKSRHRHHRSRSRERRHEHGRSNHSGRRKKRSRSKSRDRSWERMPYHRSSRHREDRDSRNEPRNAHRHESDVART